MKDIVLKCEREGVEGVIPVGTVLGDAIRRMGVHFDTSCDPGQGEHFCVVAISSGSELLSPRTDLENEHFSRSGRSDGLRLACENTLIKPGEIVVMTVENKKEEPASSTTGKDRLVDEFSELPLEKKLASLIRMEAVALGETFDYVLSSPLKVVEKAGEVMAEFGMKLEQQAKARSRPSTETSEAGPADTGDPNSEKQKRPRAKKSGPTTKKP